MRRIWNETLISAVSEDAEFLGVLASQVDSHFHMKVYDREAVRSGVLADCDHTLILWDLSSMPTTELQEFLGTHPAVLRTCSLLIVADEGCLDAAVKVCEDGAIDFLLKPVRAIELRSRLRLSRRPWVRAMRTTFDFLGSMNVDFTTMEQRILLCFLASPDFSASRAEINNELWRSSSVNSNSLDVHLFNIRKKIEPNGLQIRFNNKLGAWTLSPINAQQSPLKVDKKDPQGDSV